MMSESMRSLFSITIHNHLLAMVTNSSALQAIYLVDAQSKSLPSTEVDLARLEIQNISKLFFEILQRRIFQAMETSPSFP